MKINRNAAGDIRLVAVSAGEAFEYSADFCIHRFKARRPLIGCREHRQIDPMRKSTPVEPDRLSEDSLDPVAGDRVTVSTVDQDSVAE